MKSSPRFTLACALLAGGLLAGTVSTDISSANRIRIAISEDVAGAFNGIDAKSVMKAWVMAIGHEIGMEIEYDPNVVSTPEQLAQKIRDRSVDTFVLNTMSYMQVATLVDSTILVDSPVAELGDEYIILVHENSGIRDLASLRGHSIVTFKHWMTSLADPWLEILLADSNLGSSNAFFSRRNTETKLIKVVLPVFFKQSDACLVTRRGFNTMCELNPQLGKDLRVLATSPRVIPGFLALHKDCALARKKRFVTAMENLAQTMAGRQALTIFQTSKMVSADVSCLKPSLDLLLAYERIKKKGR